MTVTQPGRPRDRQLDRAILTAARDLLAAGSYAELSMESVAAHAGVGKKTVYRRWPSKAPLVAEAVLEAYGGSGSFPVADTGDIRADLRSWLNDHANFLAEAPNGALIRALVAAAAANSSDGVALYQQLSAPQHEGLMTRLRQGMRDKQIRDDADLDAVADALIGTLLLHALNHGASPTRLDALLDALLNGIGQ